MPDSDPAIWHLRKQGATESFGPVTFAQLSAWAEAAQISPLDSVSPDGSTWQRAPMVAELQMDWLVELGDGALYGPTTLGALREFLHAGEITFDCELINACEGTRQVVGDMIPTERLDPIRHETATDDDANEAVAAPARTGIKANLQQRIRQLEEMLLDARREAQMWRDRFERGRGAAEAEAEADEAGEEPVPARENPPAV